MSIELGQTINKQVANWNVLYFKLHNYHWYIKGHHFFTLHEKFEELYNEASGYVDELAERALAINAKPIGTLEECLKLASIKEASGEENEESMVKSVMNDFRQIVKELQDGISLAEQANDEVTGDMFIGMKQSLEKHIWMLGAFLGS